MKAREEKAVNEQKIFKKFCERQETLNEWLKIESRPEPEPDLLCLHSKFGAIAFELVGLIDGKIAEFLAIGLKGRLDAFFTEDPTRNIILKKLTKKYKTIAKKIELLIYTDSRLVTPDDIIISELTELLQNRKHIFDTIWFMGEGKATCIFRKNN
jgi:hypothetical protein